MTEHTKDRHFHIDATATAPVPLWQQPARRFNACENGPCDKGRRLCPSPDACELAERRAELAERRAARGPISRFLHRLAGR